VYLSAWCRDLIAQDQDFDVFGAVVAGELGQHLQYLTQQQVDQRRARNAQPDSRRNGSLAHSRTSDG